VITNLYVQEGSIYAAAPNQRTWLESNDNGQTWQYLVDAPDTLSDRLDQDQALPKTVCDPEDSSWCFRVAGEGFVERSDDSGVTWRIAWEVPPGRLMVMERLTTDILGSKEIDLGPYDVVFAGSSDDRRAVIAMGNEGILLIDRKGGWSRVPAGADSNPTPFEVREADDIVQLLGWETFILLAIAVVGWVLLNRLYWQPVLDAMSAKPALRPTTNWVTKPLRIARLAALGLLVGIVIVALQTDMSFTGLFGGWPLAIAVLFALAVPFLGQLSSRRRLAQEVSNSSWPIQALWPVLLGIVGVLTLGYAPFVLWALGAIPWYWMAMVVSVSIVLAAAAWARRQIRYCAARTVETIS
jgi:hypothetical protein